MEYPILGRSTTLANRIQYLCRDIRPILVAAVTING